MATIVAATSALTAVLHVVAAYGFHRTNAVFARNVFAICSGIWVGLTVFWGTR